MMTDEIQYLSVLHRLWEKNWPHHLPKVPRYPHGEILLTDYLREWAERTPHKPCWIYYGTEFTFKQLDEWSDRFAGFLSSRGLKKEDRIAVFLPSCPQFMIAFYGILKLGCIHVPVNPMFKEHEFLYEINDAGAKLILTLDQLYPIVQAARKETPLEEVVVTRFADFLPPEPSIPLPKMLQLLPRECPGALGLMAILARQEPSYPRGKVGLDDVAALNYTGGTTGMPKGCVHTQRDMIYTAATTCTFAVALAPEDIGLNFLPVFWISGENNGLIFPVFSGCTHVILARWDPIAAMTAIDRYKVTFGTAVTDNVVEMIEHPEAGKYNLRSIRTMNVSSFVRKLNLEYRRKWEALTGGVVREAAWGMTETHTMDTFTNGLQQDDMDLKTQPVMVGLPMPGTEIKIVDFGTGDLVPLGQEGELAIRTPSLLKSYWNKPEETRRALRNRWLHTGDIGMLDEEGYLHFLGRRKEMLKVKGMNVFPSEIEAILGRHPAILGSAVLGRSHPEKGEDPFAFVMLRPEYKGRVTPEDLSRWCGENMAVYKVPTFKIMEELPLTATGKVKKEELRNQVDPHS